MNEKNHTVIDLWLFLTVPARVHLWVCAWILGLRIEVDYSFHRPWREGDE